MVSLKLDWSLSNQTVQIYLDNYKYSIKTSEFSLEEIYTI